MSRDPIKQATDKILAWMRALDYEKDFDSARMIRWINERPLHELYVVRYEIDVLRAELATAQADMREKYAAHAAGDGWRDYWVGQPVNFAVAASIRALPLAGAASKGEGE